MPLSKKNHSMIYFNQYVYIIGGDDEKTIIYDTIKMAFSYWQNLNQKKFEPSLIISNSNLFCIDSSMKYSSELNIEKIDISKAISQWEIIKPKINYDIKEFIFAQKFFGLIEDKNENIIFLGGKYENNNENNSDFNLILMYNVNNNLIEKNEELNLIGIDNIKDIQFNEKSFLNLDNNTYIIFPDFIRRAPKILYYYKDKNCLEMKLYHSNPHLTQLTKSKTEKKMNIKEKPLKGSSIKKYNKNTDINIIQNNFIGKTSTINDKYNDNNKNKSSILKSDKKINDKEINKNKISKNSELNNIINDKKSRESINSDNKENIDINKKDDEKISDKKLSRENSRGPEKIGLDNSKQSSIKEIESNKSKEKINDKEKEEGKEEQKEEEEEKEEETKKVEEKEISDKDDNSIENDKKNEQPTEINEDEDSDDKTKQEKKLTQMSQMKEINLDIFNNNHTYFHSSVNNNPMNNFEKLENNRAVKKNIRMRNIFHPKEISNKSLKLARNHFNKNVINDIEEFNNY